MQATLYEYKNNEIVQINTNKKNDQLSAQLVLVFGQKEKITDPDFYHQLSSQFSCGIIALCSTAGEIIQEEVHENTIAITTLCFEKTNLEAHRINIADYSTSYEAGKSLAALVNQEQLAYLMILSDGSLVNGSELIKGIEEIVDQKIPVTGGLAGDGTNFTSTAVGLNQIPQEGEIVAIGFYGTHLEIGHASLGGWDMFGPEKMITKAEGNVLYEIDGKNALEIYKEYLGKYADELPSSALLFPLAIQTDNTNQNLVRTILSIDNEKQSLTFAGDMPLHAPVRFMKANFDRLIDASSQAANIAFKTHIEKQPDYAMLISCVGRKIILNNRIDEEVEAVSESLKNNTVMSGFYSYGELSPFNESSICQLHNQTMTITTFIER